MNVNSLIASLIAPAQGTAAASAGAAAASTTPDTNSAQFKAQFGQAVAALTTIVTKAQSSGGTSSSSSAPATAGGTAATTATDALQAALQKKISDLLAAGNSVQQIVQQLAGALANVFAGQLSGANLAQIQTQLQATFAAALSPPGNGPPASLADLASTLAQRFRQIADLAAGVIGETGQSNRLFAGSFSDAATTAGGQPAPGSTNGNTTADSIASDASALLASLTASQGDGKTVASTAPAIGTNGDTLLGRILARATPPPASPVTPSPSDASTSSSSTAAPAPATGPNVTASAVDRAIAAATALLGQSLTAAAAPSATPATATIGAVATAAAAIPVDALSALASKSVAPASPTTDAAVTTAAASTNGSLSTSVTAFVKSFTEALAATGAGAPAATDKPVTDDDGTATVLPTTVASTQAPTIGAFAPVAPALHVDALSANPATPSVPQQSAPPDPNTVIDQVLRGAFLVTTGDSSTVRLRLVPESLGDVTVKLNISGTSVDAQVVAQTPAAHDALVAGQAQLTRSLSDAGLKLTSFNVSLGGGGFTSFQQQQQQSAQHQTPSGQRLLLGDVDTSETDDPSLAAVPSFAPPTSAATGWGAYNYLV
jgi:flagellar hook-length control protein FliK